MKNHFPVKKCTFCDSISIARGLCRKHYIQERNNGSLISHAKLTKDEIFESRIHKTDSCWVWIGARNSAGYGMLQLQEGGKKIRAHRYSYELYKGGLLNTDLVLHSCDNPSCVNPEHLRKGTHAENSKDKVNRNRTKYGESHWSYKLTTVQVHQIRTATGTNSQIAASFGVNQSTVSRIKNGHRRRLG